MRISGILSDYDGTLCPTSSIRSKENNIPKELENILWDIADTIPICIVSSKDFNFLHNKARFANVISSILGIETLVLKPHERRLSESVNSKECQEFRCIQNSCLSSNYTSLKRNSELLSQLAEEIASRYNEVYIERKFTVYNKILAGITVDWRNVDDWESFKVKSEHQLMKTITEKQRKLERQDRPKGIHIQTYSTHPFIDIYAAKCDKGIAYESILSQIFRSERKDEYRIMYLGDSENDNPAFRKADISIGIRSDERLNPDLHCRYTVNFGNLAGFLEKLRNDNFVFSGA
jgi:HAD superfamily hydrolase (TIGR01484 family)